MESSIEDSELSRSVCYNYIIMKKVFRHLTWRELKEIETICRLWREIVEELRKAVLHPFDFCVVANRRNFTDIFCSDETLVEPGLVITFLTSKIVHYPYHESQLPWLGRKRVTQGTLFQYMHTNFFDLQKNMIGVSCDKMFYIHPANRKQTPKNGMIMSGMSLPKIPGVSYHLIRVTELEYDSEFEEEFQKINDIMAHEIVKCVVIFAAERKCDLHESYVQKMIRFIDEKQKVTHPSIRFAVGGCNIKMSHSVDLDSSDLAGDNMNILIMTVNKTDYENVQFDAFSKVFSFYSNSKNAMKKDFRTELDQVCNLVPKRQYSACLKFSCFKRKSVFDAENFILFTLLPNTPIIGCDAMGEIGVDCIPEPVNDDGPSKKRVCSEQPQAGDCIHSFSTILIMLTWGHLL